MKNILALLFLLISTQTLLATTPNTDFSFKKALLIDNHAYTRHDVLPSNSLSVNQLAGELYNLGFDVSVLSNLPANQLKARIEEFYQSADGESPTLFYYSGRIFIDENHGSALMPVDAVSQESEIISLREINQLAVNNNKTGNNQNFLLIDASFDTEQKNLAYPQCLGKIPKSDGVIFSAHNAKGSHLASVVSDYIPVLINELYEVQKIETAFSRIDNQTESISWMKTSLLTNDFFYAELAASVVSANMSMSIVDMPTFPFPPPKASANYTFDKNLFAGLSNLTQSSERIENALKKSGYYEKSYYQIPNGYALVTRIEKMESNGAPAPEDERWNVNDKGTSSFDLFEYFKSLFLADEGHYRIIVFLVTSDNVQMTDRIMLMSEGEDFLSSGLNRLPPEFDAMPFTDSHYCTALIYEWHKIEHEEAVFMEPSKFLGQYHLAKNKFVEYLEAEK